MKKYNNSYKPYLRGNKSFSKLIYNYSGLITISPKKETSSISSLTYIDASIQKCICYIINNIDKNGKFLYFFNLIERKKGTKYNILRHAGTLYSIYQALQTITNKEIWHNAQISNNYLYRQIYFNENYPNTPIVVDSNFQVKLGANALTIIMLLEKNKLRVNEDEILLIYQLAKFIVLMQLPSGKFKSKINIYDWSTMNFNSDYYPSQACLSLIRLYKKDKDNQWLSIAKNGIEYIIKNRKYEKSSDVFIHDQWLMMALVEIYEITGDEKYILKCRIIADLVIDSFNDSKVLKNICGLATRIEGLNSLAAIEKITNVNNYYKIIIAVTNIIPLIINAQLNVDYFINDINLIGGIIKSKEKYTIRIDYVQHVMSALLSYSNLAKDIKYLYMD